MKHSVPFIVALLFTAAAFGQTRISSGEAWKHIGERVTVSGKIASSKVFTRPNQTVLFVGGTYPNHHLTVVVNQEERRSLGFKPEDLFPNRKINVTGKLIEVDGRAELILNDFSEIKQEEGNNDFELKPLDVSSFNRFFDEE